MITEEVCTVFPVATADLKSAAGKLASQVSLKLKESASKDTFSSGARSDLLYRSVPVLSISTSCMYQNVFKCVCV